MEKKQRNFDKIIEEEKAKHAQLVADYENSQKDARAHANEVFKMRNTYEESLDALESAKREHKQLQEEITELNDQVSTKFYFEDQTRPF